MSPVKGTRRVLEFEARHFTVQGSENKSSEVSSVFFFKALLSFWVAMVHGARLRSLRTP